MQIFTDTNYDFIKYRWHAVVISLVFIAAGLGLFLTRGVNMGIDFAGGANVILRFQQEPPLAQLRSQLPDATIQQYGPANQNSVLIRLPKQKTEGDYAGLVVAKLHTTLNPQAASKLNLNFHGSDPLQALLQQADPDVRGTNPAAIEHYRQIAKRIIDKRSELGIFTSMQQVTGVPGISTAIARTLNERAFLGNFNVLNQETVGPQVGEELQQKALLAIILSSLAMGAYIWLRFDVMFAVAAIICIIHDVLIALAFMVAMNLEFNLNVVAALLTIVGYSINDTVVTYDRIRENRRKMKKPMSLAEHLNLAMNQTLSRTILTAGSVFLVLVAMLIFGGDVIRGFSWILTIGVISGTYSTLLIVPAVAVAWERWLDRKRPATAAAPARNDVPRSEPQTRKRKAS
jgi:preprotein translocase subunit SecF